jgi:hypothetical protein
VAVGYLEYSFLPADINTLSAEGTAGDATLVRVFASPTRTRTASLQTGKLLRLSHLDSSQYDDGQKRRWKEVEMETYEQKDR